MGDDFPTMDCEENVSDAINQDWTIRTLPTSRIWNLPLVEFNSHLDHVQSYLGTVSVVRVSAELDIDKDIWDDDGSVEAMS